MLLTVCASAASMTACGVWVCSYELPILTTTITHRVVYAETAAAGESVFERDPRGPAAAEIDSLATDLEDLAS